MPLERNEMVEIKNQETIEIWNLLSFIMFSLAFFYIGFNQTSGRIISWNQIFDDEAIFPMSLFLQLLMALRMRL